MVPLIAFGDLQERYLRPGESLLPFWLGTWVGLAPWLAIAFYILGIGNPDRDLSQVPGFVWGIVFALFAKSLLAWQVFANTLIPPG